MSARLQAEGRLEFEVIFGRLTADQIARALKCDLCGGDGKSATGGPCAECDGSGTDPHPGYAYKSGQPVFVGDIVLTPPNWHFKLPQEATVVRLGTIYEGALSPIRRVLRHVGVPEADSGGEAAS